MNGVFDLGGPFDSAVPPGESLLVGGPPLTGKRRLGLEVLRRGLDADEAGVLVTTTVTAERALSLAPFPPESIGVVDCVARHLGVSTASTDRVRFASSPGDMTGIGIEFSELVGELDRAGNDRIRVVFDSLTPLLVYADVQTVYRFLHVTVRHVETVGALGVFTVDATAHPDEELAVLERLFDGRITTGRDEAPTLTRDSDTTHSA